MTYSPMLKKRLDPRRVSLPEDQLHKGLNLPVHFKGLGLPALPGQPDHVRENSRDPLTQH